MPTDPDVRTSFAGESRCRRVTRQFPSGNQSGQALIIVLGFVMLMTVLILVFFSSVITERTSSKAVASGVSARQLAQSAVQLVEGTISTATVPADPTGTAIAWACQPGMIRTYGSGSPGAYAAAASPLAYYKLYSSNNMVLPASVVDSAYSVDYDASKTGGDLVTTWDKLPALYTDLNAPIAASDGSIVYPIADPRAVASGVQGFSYSASTPSGTAIDGVVTGNGSNLMLPMPVQWIYVLRDGTLTSPSEPNTASPSASNVATFGGANPPTANNPIVGRIAFWTDDECSKVNLNTASEGTYWDTPVCDLGNAPMTLQYQFTNTAYPSAIQTGQTLPLGDVVLAEYIPAQHEFQRYPGHPATTCLSEIFASPIGSETRSSMAKDIDSLAPRISDTDGGSGVSTLGGTGGATAILQQKFDRLYATVDDFNFPPGRASAQTLNNGASVQNILEQSRFFLTTQSKAPDLNPFGLPKVSIWPVWDDGDGASMWSTLDKAMIHCSTVANGALAGSQHRMIFTRRTPTDSTTDFSLTDPNGNPRNKELFEYLQTMTGRAIPGFGGNFATKYGSSVTLPSSASVTGNTTTGIDQILAEIYDYIRCTNLADQSLATTASYTPSVPTTNPNVMALGQVVPIQISATNTSSTPRGLGRIATISELALVLVKMDDRVNTANAEVPVTNIAPTVTITDPDTGAPTTFTPSPTGSSSNTCIEWAVIPKLFSPMAGYVGLGNNLRIHYTNFSLSINSTPVVPTPTQVLDLYDTGRLGATTRDSLIGGGIGFIDLAGSATHTGYAPAQSSSMFPTGLVVVPGYSANLGSAPGTMTVQGSFTVQVYAGTVGTGQTLSGNLIQTLNFTIPSQTVPIPILATYTSGSASNPPIIPNIWSGAFRAATYTTTGPTPVLKYPAAITGTTASKGSRVTGFSGYLTAYDVIRSVVSTGALTASGPNLEGDMRLIAASNCLSDTAFTSTLLTNQALNPTVVGVGTAPYPSTLSVNSLRNGTVLSVPGAGFSSLVTTQAASSYGLVPEVPPLGAPAVPPATAMTGINSPQMTNTNDTSSGSPCPADWDNGPGLLMDGPYCNKADEGQPPGTTTPALPYLFNYDSTVSAGLQATTFYSPNRQISSPVMFGSLPVGLDHPWRTLLFRPPVLPGYQETATTQYTHPGGADPKIPDHTLLDFFRMPIVEPYAISEPLATAGKVNLNTQIAPFTYITRNTGMRAVLKSVMITALSSTATNNYKGAYYSQGGPPSYTISVISSAAQQSAVSRYPIDLFNTLAMLNPGTPDSPSGPGPSSTSFPEFTRTTYQPYAPNFFISPSQICDVPLIPLLTSRITTVSGGGSGSVSLTGLGTFWAANGLTGDNSLEKPYSSIYPRVTTQSNTFTVHVRAQSLQKATGVGGGAPNVWTEGTDQVTGEYRGSFTVEKYFDPTYAVITDSSGTIQTDTSDATLPASAAIRGDNNDGSLHGANALVHGALWRLLYDKRFGQ